MQLVELQQVVGALAAQHVALFAISYDSVETLAGFAEKNGISYPLLADEGSHVIRALGLLDEDLEAHHAEFGSSVRDEQRGVCYPGVFLLDERGVVAQRRFQRNYRVRESGSALVEEALGIATPASVSTLEVDQERVRVRVHVDSPTYWRYQRLYAVLDVDVAPGYHIYAPPTPAEYTALTVDVSGTGVEVGSVDWPSATPLRLESINEQFWTYSKQLRVAVPFEIVGQRGEEMGSRTVQVRVKYQACDESICYLPQEATFEFRLEERPAVT